MNRYGIDWSDAMRAARNGNAGAYASLLRDVAAWLRPMIRQALARAGRTDVDVEDIVQDTLMGIHLKRHTWDGTRPIAPWIRAIARHKMLDALGRGGNGRFLPIEDFADRLVAEAPQPSTDAPEVGRALAALPQGQRQVLSAIAIEGLTIAEAARRFTMQPGAVRVALHRAIRSLARRAGKP